MKKILIFLLIFISFHAAAQTHYNPINGSLSNKPFAPAQAVPTDMRSFFYDSVHHIFRAYQSTAEVLSYLNLSKWRAGNFPIYVHTGGVLNGDGTYTGGTIAQWWFKDGVTDGDLVLFSVGSGGSLSELNTSLPIYFKNDSTLASHAFDSLWITGGHLHGRKDSINTDIGAIGGSGNPNSNIGSGYRWAVPGTNNIKTIFAGSGLNIDSTSNANALTISVVGTGTDTVVVFHSDTIYANKKLVIPKKDTSVFVHAKAQLDYQPSDNHFYGDNGTKWLCLDCMTDTTALHAELVQIISQQATNTANIATNTSNIALKLNTSDFNSTFDTRFSTDTAGHFIGIGWLPTLAAKQNAITIGTTGQYFRGDLSLATFPTIPAQFNPIAGTNITLSGTYPNITFNSSGSGGGTSGLTRDSLPTFLGTILNQKTFTSTNYTVGSNATLSSGKFQFTNASPSAPTLGTALRYNYTTCSEKWRQAAQLVTTSSTVKAYVGVLAASTSSSYAFFSGTSGSGTVSIYTGTAPTLVATSGVLSYTSGDTLLVSFERRQDTLFASVWDKTTLSLPINISYGVSFASAVNTHGISNWFVDGGGFTLDSLNIFNKGIKNAPLLIVTHSKGEYYPTLNEQSYPRIVAKNFSNVVLLSSPGSGSTEMLGLMPEILAYNPMQVILDMNTNDNLGLSTWKTNDSTMYAQLKAAGIRTFFLDDIYASATGETIYNYITSTYPDSSIIHVHNITKNSAYLSDAFHQNSAGHFVTAQAILNDGKLKYQTDAKNTNRFVGPVFVDSLVAVKGISAGSNIFAGVIAGGGSAQTTPPTGIFASDSKYQNDSALNDLKFSVFRTFSVEAGMTYTTTALKLISLANNPIQFFSNNQYLGKISTAGLVINNAISSVGSYSFVPASTGGVAGSNANYVALDLGNQYNSTNNDFASPKISLFDAGGTNKIAIGFDLSNGLYFYSFSTSYPFTFNINGTNYFQVKSTGIVINQTPSTNSETNPAILIRNAGTNLIDVKTLSTLAGAGVASSADLTAQTAAGTITSVTSAAANSTYDVGGYINVTAISVDVIQAQITYTDENNTSQTISLANVSAIGNSSIGVQTIRVKASTTITLKTNLTTGAGSITFDAGGYIKKDY